MITLGSKREQGFTLIEMSIVLIIIGLIIGGILKGQELIESARQKNFISQTDSIKAGVNSFIDRFRAFPGDIAQGSAVCAVCVAGNGNGILNTAVANAAAIAGANGMSGENYEFFNHLVGAGFLGGGGAALATTGSANFSGGTNSSPLPQSAFPQSGMSIVYGTHEGAASGAGSLLSNWVRVAKYGTAVTSSLAVLPPVRGLQMDGKYDDGLPMTGNLRTLGLDTGNCGTAGSNSSYGSVTSVQCDIVWLLE